MQESAQGPLRLATLGVSWIPLGTKGPLKQTQQADGSTTYNGLLALGWKLWEERAMESRTDCGYYHSPGHLHRPNITHVHSIPF